MVKIKDLKKDLAKSVRINSEVEQILKDKGYSLQSFLDEQLDKLIKISAK